MDDDHGQSKVLQVLLPFEVAVDSNEDVKRLLRNLQERTVFGPSPTSFRYGLHFMARKGRFDTGVNALV